MSEIDEKLNEMRLKEHDLVENTANRVPICIVVDTSYSMVRENRIKHVNNGLKQFIEAGADDDYASDSLDICIITFGRGKGKVVQEFANISSIRFEPLKASGNSPLGSAVNLAIKTIEQRLEQYLRHGITSFKPWLIIMSDGEGDPTDAKNLEKATEETRKLVRERRIKVMCIDMNRAEKNNDLRKFSIDGTTSAINALQIEDFFYMLSRSAAGLSSSTPGEDEANLEELVHLPGKEPQK